MVPRRDSLEALAKAYTDHLMQRDQQSLKKYLSVDFITRQKVTEQLKLIQSLPNMFFGLDIEIHIFGQYKIVSQGGRLKISPFRFDVSYTPHTNLIAIERMTLTIHSVVLEAHTWKIESIVSNQKKRILVDLTRGG